MILSGLPHDKRSLIWQLQSKAASTVSLKISAFGDGHAFARPYKNYKNDQTLGPPATPSHASFCRGGSEASCPLRDGEGQRVPARGRRRFQAAEGQERRIDVVLWPTKGFVLFVGRVVLFFFGES